LDVGALPMLKQRLLVFAEPVLTERVVESLVHRRLNAELDFVVQLSEVVL
jgi:hypothetical protein